MGGGGGDNPLGLERKKFRKKWGKTLDYTEKQTSLIHVFRIIIFL